MAGFLGMWRWKPIIIIIIFFLFPSRTPYHAMLSSFVLVLFFILQQESFLFLLMLSSRTISRLSSRRHIFPLLSSFVHGPSFPRTARVIFPYSGSMTMIPWLTFPDLPRRNWPGLASAAETAGDTFSCELRRVTHISIYTYHYRYRYRNKCAHQLSAQSPADILKLRTRTS